MSLVVLQSSANERPLEEPLFQRRFRADVLSTPTSERSPPMLQFEKRINLDSRTIQDLGTFISSQDQPVKPHSVLVPASSQVYCILM